MNETEGIVEILFATIVGFILTVAILYMFYVVAKGAKEDLKENE